MHKTIQSREELFIQFTDEEVEQLGLSKGDKFTMELVENGVLLKPFGEVEIDLDEIPVESLKFIIGQSLTQDVSCHEVISSMLEKALGLCEGPIDPHSECDGCVNCNCKK